MRPMVRVTSILNLPYFLASSRKREQPVLWLDALLQLSTAMVFPGARPASLWQGALGAPLGGRLESTWLLRHVTSESLPP